MSTSPTSGSIELQMTFEATLTSERRAELQQQLEGAFKKLPIVPKRIQVNSGSTDIVISWDWNTAVVAVGAAAVAGAAILSSATLKAIGTEIGKKLFAHFSSSRQEAAKQPESEGDGRPRVADFGFNSPALQEPSIPALDGTVDNSVVGATLAITVQDILPVWARFPELRTGTIIIVQRTIVKDDRGELHDEKLVELVDGKPTRLENTIKDIRNPLS